MYHRSIFRFYSAYSSSLLNPHVFGIRRNSVSVASTKNFPELLESYTEGKLKHLLLFWIMNAKENRLLANTWLQLGFNVNLHRKSTNLMLLSLSLSLPFTFFFSFVVRYFPASYFFSSQLCANKENNLKYFFNKLHYGSINILNKFIIFVVFTNEFWTKKVRSLAKSGTKTLQTTGSGLERGEDFLSRFTRRI